MITIYRYGIMSAVYLLMFSCTAGAQNGVLSLSDAIDSALKRNWSVKLAENTVARSLEELKQARYARLPDLTADPQVSMNWGRTLDVSTYNYVDQRVSLISGSFNSQFTIFQGGQLKARILENKLIIEADRSAVAKTKFDLTLSVVTTFMSALASEDMLNTAKQQLELAQMTERDIKKRYDAGNRSEADLAQARSQAIKTELTITDLQSRYDADMLALRQLTELPDKVFTLGRPDTTLLNPGNYTLDAAALINYAMERDPNVRIARQNIQIAQQRIRVSASAYYPTVYLFGSVGTNFSDARTLLTGSRQLGFDTIGTVSGTGQSVLTPTYQYQYAKYPMFRQFADNFYKSAGISLQIPIFNRSVNQIAVKKAKLDLENKLMTEKLTVSNFIKIFEQAIADLRMAQRKLEAYQKNMAEIERLLQVNKKRYQTGFINAIEYNTVLTDHNKAQLELVQAKYALLFRKKIIDYYTGDTLTF